MASTHPQRRHEDEGDDAITTETTPLLAPSGEREELKPLLSSPSSSPSTSSPSPSHPATSSPPNPSPKPKSSSSATPGSSSP
ncbi:hypothetical protein RRF57_009252 [Xylaria bambusicola]|uniref:Uncharacterized protein n=1 Tax=Xylaria bambusicola TaxID=326684 RepID=A0AAN7UPG0_9PEZI